MQAQQRLEDLLARAGLTGAKATAVKAAFVLVAVAIGFALLQGTRAPAIEFASDDAESESAPHSVATTAAASVGVVVHVAGAVRTPGVYELATGARVDDAIRAAGGTLGSSSTDALNLARILQDGEQVYVPTQDEVEEGKTAAPGLTGSDASVSGSGLVNLNTATEAELDALPGVGPSTAQKIVADRDANGPFGTVDDLQRVSGIGVKKLESLRDLVTVQ
ncbi:MAG: helix-hairpin-helix domain-containing protein [Coriobacteriia bacterium]|nr:helix-hairpin-helix domain-containing protein [Coriobacteriia bacterium]MBN2822665.1 helix-hairpin-helix domain-containing protein [Coriobacteriia bacterium]